MARIGGPFPFPISDIPFGGGYVTLNSGGVFYPPAGSYWWQSGACTLLQTFDPVQGQWRSWSNPTTPTSNFDCDGYNWRFLNVSGTVQGALVTNPGSGATNGIGTQATGVTLTVAAPAAPGQQAALYPIVGGAVAAPTVNTAGTGFLVPPAVFIDPPPYGGIQATAYATLTAAGGGIASIVMDNPGAGYLVAPNFYLVPQPGSYQGAPQGGVAAGALPPPGIVNPASSAPGVVPVYFGPGTAATAGALLNAATLTGSGTLTGIGLILPGSLYTGTTIPAVTIAGCGAAAAIAVMSFVMTGISGLAGGTGYTGAPPMFETSEGVVVTAGVGQLNNYDLGGRPARGVATIAGGVVTGLVIEDNGFGLQKVPTLSFLNSGSLATGQATATAVVGGVVDTITLQAKVT